MEHGLIAALIASSGGGADRGGRKQESPRRCAGLRFRPKVERSFAVNWRPVPRPAFIHFPLDPSIDRERKRYKDENQNLWSLHFRVFV
jgi:hypothetical protein